MSIQLQAGDRINRAEGLRLGFPVPEAVGQRYVEGNGNVWEVDWSCGWTFVEGASAESDDPVSPSHYQGFSNGAEVIDITENLNFNRGNAIKYAARAGTKDPAKELEDLRKAKWYIEREISRLENQ